LEKRTKSHKIGWKNGFFWVILVGKTDKNNIKQVGFQNFIVIFAFEYDKTMH